MGMESSVMVGHVSTKMWAYFAWQMMNMCLFGECRSVLSSVALVSLMAYRSSVHFPTRMGVILLIP